MLNELNKQNRLVQLNEHIKEPFTNKEISRLEARDILNQCVNKLPAVQKSVLLLRDLEGYNYQEIGQILALTESQVKVYLFRARKRMKKELELLYY